jgi:hypothetical protein
MTLCSSDYSYHPKIKDLLRLEDAWQAAALDYRLKEVDRHRSQNLFSDPNMRIHGYCDAIMKSFVSRQVDIRVSEEIYHRAFRGGEERVFHFPSITDLDCLRKIQYVFLSLIQKGCVNLPDPMNKLLDRNFTLIEEKFCEDLRLDNCIVPDTRSAHYLNRIKDLIAEPCIQSALKLYIQAAERSVWTQTLKTMADCREAYDLLKGINCPRLISPELIVSCEELARNEAEFSETAEGPFADLIKRESDRYDLMKQIFLEATATLNPETIIWFSENAVKLYVGGFECDVWLWDRDTWSQALQLLIDHQCSSLIEKEADTLYKEFLLKDFRRSYEKTERERVYLNIIRMLIYNCRCLDAERIEQDKERALNLYKKADEDEVFSSEMGFKMRRFLQEHNCLPTIYRT